MTENPPGLTLNTLTLDSVPFPGLLATDEQREAYFQYELDLARRPPPEPLQPIVSGPDLLDALNDMYQAAREKGREEGRNAEREASKAIYQAGRDAEREARRRKVTLQARRDAQRLHRLMDSCGLGLDDAGKSLCQDLMREGVHIKTAANRVSKAKNALESDLTTG
jgi:hypothetical protein